MLISCLGSEKNCISKKDCGCLILRIVKWFQRQNARRGRRSLTASIRHKLGLNLGSTYGKIGAQEVDSGTLLVYRTVVNREKRKCKEYVDHRLC